MLEWRSTHGLTGKGRKWEWEIITSFGFIHAFKWMNRIGKKRPVGKGTIRTKLWSDTILSVILSLNDPSGMAWNLVFVADFDHCLLLFHNDGQRCVGWRRGCMHFCRMFIRCTFDLVMPSNYRNNETTLGPIFARYTQCRVRIAMVWTLQDNVFVGARGNG